MKKILFFVILAIGLLGAPALEAQDKTPPPMAESDALTLAVDRAEKLTLPESADTVFVANPDVADVQVLSPVSIMVYGRRPGTTSLSATRKDGTLILQRKIIVDKDLGKLQDVLTGMLPRIRALPVPGGIVLSGKATSSAEAADAQRIAKKFLSRDRDEVINRLKVAGAEQIQLRVRVAEVSKTVNKIFGINWDALSVASNFTLGLVSGSSFYNSTTGVMSRVGENNALMGGYQGRRIRINGLIDALADDGLIALLAEPNLTAKSGETATFLSGGEFPIPVPQQNGAIGIEYKPYGVALSFTPTVIGGDRISIHVRPEVSELTSVGSITLQSISIPALITRRAETTIELGSGQSFAIGGLIRSTQNNDISKFPFLGDLPVLGALFRSTQFQNAQSELVIIVTPYIVRPSSAPLATPTDGYAPANDIERILTGTTFAEGIPNMPQAGGVRLDGPVGFMEE